MAANEGVAPPSLVFGIDSRIRSYDRPGFAGYRAGGDAFLWRFFVSIVASPDDAERLLRSPDFIAADHAGRAALAYEARNARPGLTPMQIDHDHPAWQIDHLRLLFASTEPVAPREPAPPLLWIVPRLGRAAAVRELADASADVVAIRCYDRDHFELVQGDGAEAAARDIRDMLARPPIEGRHAGL